MQLPFQMFLNEFKPYLSNELISDSMLESMVSFTQRLPPTSSGILECRLGENRENIDYQICIEPEIITQDYSFEKNFDVYLNSFCEAWVDDNSVLKKYVENIWLEFDAKNLREFNQIPCIFSHLHKNFNDNPIAIAKTFLEHFKYLPDTKCLLLLEKYVELLPKNLTFTYLGYLCSRSYYALRAGIYGNSLDELVDYLKLVGWQEKFISSQIEIQNKFSSISKYFKHYMLSFDFNETIFPRIGLECNLSSNSYDYLEWEPVLEYLVSCNLCTPLKKEALIKWHQPSKPKKVVTESSSSLFNQSINSYFAMANMCKHSISHIKFVYEPDKPIEAKAYLSFACY